MDASRKKLIFDTSAINGIAEEPDGGIAIIRCIRLLYHVGITETVLAEVVANSNDVKRKKLLDVLDRLVHCGHCVMPFQWIIEQQAKAYQRDPKAYEWRKLNIRFLAGEQEIPRQEIIHSMSDETRASNKKWDQEFMGMFRAARAAFQSLFDSGEERPSLKAVTEHLMSGGGAYLSIGAGLMERATKIMPPESEVKDFIDRCPPFKALLIALCFSQYDRCIRGENEPSLGKAGRYDTFSAVYLPYCRVFVTRDEGQWKALTAIADLMGREMSILMYDDFKAGFLGLSTS